MTDLDPKSAEANVLRKMAIGRPMRPEDFPEIPDVRWATKSAMARALNGALMRLEVRGYVSSKDVRPRRDERCHHREWSITIEGMEMATILEVMES